MGEHGQKFVLVPRRLAQFRRGCPEILLDYLAIRDVLDGEQEYRGGAALIEDAARVQKQGAGTAFFVA